jgi:hypothetical protein
MCHSFTLRRHPSPTLGTTAEAPSGISASDMPCHAELIKDLMLISKN